MAETERQEHAVGPDLLGDVGDRLDLRHRAFNPDLVAVLDAPLSSRRGMDPERIFRHALVEQFVVVRRALGMLGHLARQQDRRCPARC